MAENPEQISGRLREERRSSNTIDQSLLNRSSSGSEGADPEQIEAPQETASPGEDYAELRVQQNQARNEQAASNNQGGLPGVGGQIGAAMGIGGSKDGGKSPEEVMKKKFKKMIIRSVLAPIVGGCCFPGCLIFLGFLATAAILLTVLADPMKLIGLALDAVWSALKSVVGAIAGFFTTST